MIMEKLSVIIAEAAPVISSGLSNTLRRLPGMLISTIEVASMDQLEDCMRSEEPDMVIVDPAFGGVFDPLKFRKDFPSDFRLIAIELHQLQRTTRALFDACLSVLDDETSLANVIRSLAHDSGAESDDSREQLSRREKEIVALVVKGLTNKEISERLFVSIHTVTTHRRNIARKLEIHSATGLTIYAIVNHIVNIEDLNL